MKNLIIFTFILFIFITNTACSNTNKVNSDNSEMELSGNIQPKPVPLKDLSNINIIKYFSMESDFIKEFDILNSKKEKIGNYQEVVLSTNTEKNGNYIIEDSMQEFPVETKEKNVVGHFYELTKSNLKEVFSRSNLTGEKKINSTILSNTQNKWNSNDGKTYIITSINKTVKTPIKTFKNCIEVAEILDGEITISDYSQNMGMINHEVYTNKGKLYVKLSLHNTIKGVNTSTSTNNNNESNDTTVNKNSLEEIKINNLNKKVSNLQLNDYVNAVNNVSIENLGYYILHRPYQQEKDGNIYYSYAATTAENIQLVTDKRSFIKQITWKSKELTNQETLLNIQSLIQGLQKNIFIDEINNFILNDSPTKKDFGEFTVEFVKSDKGFNFSIFPK